MTRPENSRRGESCRIAVRSHLSSTTGYIGLGMLTCMPRQSARADRDREPHIGEYDAKTNAICDFSHTPPVRIRPIIGRQRQLSDARAVLLVVVFEHLGASGTQLGTILLKAGQDGEIALIDDGAAELLDIAVASLLLLGCAAARRFGDGTGGNRYRQQDKCQEKITHRVPSF